ncbi:MAG: amino acid ABC transporter substrate-binding protein [Caldilineaceae bacterium]|jgi:branched-chain amino acid transport system substrate-binding protein|nr:amino acid ABC transporter substrate-binding protein [Caldilineaceae bacterium]
MTIRSLVLSSLLILLLLLAACAPAAPAAPAGGADTAVTAADNTPADNTAANNTTAGDGSARMVTIGYTSSLTGKLNVESTRQTNGLNLWMDQVNEAGGITLADGSTVKFQSKFYDDESSGDRVQELYTKLATEDNADFLISPYSSGLTASASVIAEQYQKPMITTGAASDSNYTQGYTLVFQAYTPASKYLTGAADMIAATNPDLKKIAIVHENDKFSTDVATALESYAQEKGFDVVLFEGYDSGTTDFSPIINKVQQAAPDALLGGGHFQDGSTFARQLAEKGLGLEFLVLLVAPPEPTFAELGDAAIGVAGPSQWEPQAAYTAESAAASNLSWYGPSDADFVAAYQAAYNEEPSYHAAGGYVAGLILQAAIEQAGSTEPQAVKAALDAMDQMNFFGHIQFDASAEAHGLQTGHEMVYVQWQKDESGNLIKQIVWPPEGKTADVLTPVR